MIEIRGKRLESAWWGPGPEAAPTIVLLHEGLGCVALWRDFPAQLAAATGCGVFAYSRLGYGKSDPVALPRPLSYMHDEARDWLGPVLDAAGITSCLLLGHSDGASIAAIYGGVGPLQDHRVRGLVLIAPHYMVEQISLDAIAQAREAYAEGSLRTRLARYHDDVDGAFRGWNESWLHPDFKSFDLTGELAHIRVPMLQIQGTADPYGTTAQTDLAEQTVFCPIETVLLPARHAPHAEAPEATLAAITGFARHLLGVHENAL